MQLSCSEQFTVCSRQSPPWSTQHSLMRVIPKRSEGPHPARHFRLASRVDKILLIIVPVIPKRSEGPHPDNPDILGTRLLRLAPLLDCGPSLVHLSPWACRRVAPKSTLTLYIDIFKSSNHHIFAPPRLCEPFSKPSVNLRVSLRPEPEANWRSNLCATNPAKKTKHKSHLASDLHNSPIKLQKYPPKSLRKANVCITFAPASRQTFYRKYW